jgi:AraC family transcriptional regulator
MSYETDELRLSETVYPLRCKLRHHSHENPYFKFTLSGTYIENFGGKTRESRESMLTFHPAGETHSQYFDRTDVKLFRVEINPFWLARHTAAFESVKFESAVFEGDVVCRLAASLYCEFRKLDSVSPLVVEGLTLEILGEAVRSRKRSSQGQLPARWLKDARELLDARLTENLSLSQIAVTVGVHPVHLAREFRRCYGCTIGDYVRRLRVELACREMMKPEASLAEVSVICGFHDQSHFTKIFKRVMNTTPAAHRASFCKR